MNITKFKPLIDRIILSNIIKILDNIPFSCCLIKGNALSLQAYKNCFERKSGDVDLLLSKNNLRVLENILKNHGYYCTNENRSDRILCLNFSHQLPPFKKNCSGIEIEIDINFDLFWSEYTGIRIDISEFISDIIDIEICEFNIKTLPPLKTMIQLILHHYKEMNSIYHLAGHNSINYNMFKDVYYLWKNNQEEISLNKLYEISTKYNIVPFIFYVLYFTNCIYEDYNLKKYVEAFKTTEGVELIDWYGLADNERKPWKVDFKTRLETEYLYELIKDDLTDMDIEKLERNRRIFG